MGLLNKAKLFRGEVEISEVDKSTIVEKADFLKEFQGNVLNKDTIAKISDLIEKNIESVNAKLDRKLIDFQTLIEIGKEINSTLNLDDLIQIVIFTLMGLFQVSDVAVFKLNNNKAEIVGKRGFDGLESFSVSEDFLAFLSGQEISIYCSVVDQYTDEYQSFCNSDARVIIPMKAKDKLNGFITVGPRFTEKDFDADETGFMFTIGGLAGIAIENASLYEELDRKYKELSTLYDVSKVINSSDDYDLVLGLIQETINTGFGVNKAVLFVNENNQFIIKETVGLSDELNNQAINLTDQEIVLLDHNEVKIMPLRDSFKTYFDDEQLSLFIPLQSAGNKVGGLIIFEFDDYEITESNRNLINLFAIIASQIAPPVLMTLILKEEKERIQDPFSPVLSLMESEIDQAKDFGLDVTFAMLKLKNFNQLIAASDGLSAHERFLNMSNKLKSLLPESGNIIRYSSNQLLFILPGMADTDFEEYSDMILREAKHFFENENEPDIGLDLLSAKYPDRSEDKYTLLSLIE